MAIDRSNPIFLAPPQGQGAHNPELMLSAVLHLMSHYTAGADASGCVKLASVIERHLKALANLPDLAPVLSATCQQLSEQWATVVERTMHEQEKTNFLSRIMARARNAPATA